MDQRIRFEEVRGDGFTKGEPDYVINAVSHSEIRPGTFLRVTENDGTVTHIVHRFHDAFATSELKAYYQEEKDRADNYLQGIVRLARWKLGLPIYY
jgi:hypothetical protein